MQPCVGKELQRQAKANARLAAKFLLSSLECVKLSMMAQRSTELIKRSGSAQILKFAGTLCAQHGTGGVFAEIARA